MWFKHKFAFCFLSVLAVGLFLVLSHYALHSEMLNPKGEIAQKELTLMIIATVLMLIVVIPVFLMTFFICLKYRASNRKAVYNPNWDNNLVAEIIWWGFPFVIILILSFFTWTSSHDLDPFKPLKSDNKPITIQVVALQWKWLFIYPEEKIASINFFQIPEKTAINFEITADAPMNSFWLPQLGGQIYAMPGMKTKIHLIADNVGDYKGSSANLSGIGFAAMTFIAKATSQEDYDKWVKSVQQSANDLDMKAYDELAKPSTDIPKPSYQLKDGDLYNKVVMKFMMPSEQKPIEKKAAS